MATLVYLRTPQHLSENDKHPGLRSSAPARHWGTVTLVMEILDLHPQLGGIRYTLRGLYRVRSAANEKAGQLARADFEVRLLELVSPQSTQLFAVAAKHDVAPTRRTGIPRSHATDWEATRMAVEAFRRTVRAASRSGTPVRWYKGLDVSALHRCVTSHNWGGTLLDVSSGILSSTIITHPFPNANHRTAISLTRLFLASVGIPWPYFELKGRGIRRFVSLSTPFITSSKYLLQVLRHRPMIRLALEEGFTHLLIAGRRVEVDPSDLVRKDHDLRRSHAVLARRFVGRLVDDTGQHDLQKPCQSGLKDWVIWFRR